MSWGIELGTAAARKRRNPSPLTQSRLNLEGTPEVTKNVRVKVRMTRSLPPTLLDRVDRSLCSRPPLRKNSHQRMNIMMIPIAVNSRATRPSRRS